MTTVAEIRTNVATKPEWTERALLAIYKNQTPAEQLAHVTVEKNHIGFNGVDAEILSSFAQQMIRYNRHLSEKQLKIAAKKMPKYAQQLFNMIPTAQETK
jgi:hypothetical protein